MGANVNDPTRPKAFFLQTPINGPWQTLQGSVYAL
jgi:hypothetical protein